MSIETDFLALLVANAGVQALVSARVSQNAVAQGWSAPYVVFTAQHELLRDIEGVLHADACTLTVQCWGRSAAEAQQLADAVTAAVATAPVSAAAAVTQRASSYDEATGLDGEALAVEWWATP